MRHAEFGVVVFSFCVGEFNQVVIPKWMSEIKMGLINISKFFNF